MKKWLSLQGPFIRSYLADLDTPRALTVAMMVRFGEWDQLATLAIDPLHYREVDADKFRRDLQATDFLRKSPLPTSFDRRKAAIEAWENAETQCFHTNEFISSLWRSSSSEHASACQKFFRQVQKRMARWLGALPDHLEGGFGPGTCVEYEGRDPTVVDKLWVTPTTTPACAALFRWHYDQTLWGQSRWENRLGAPGISQGNRFTTVPKDGKTDRPICIEPVGNLWLQLGIGRYLKRRLSLVGLPDYKPERKILFPSFEYAAPDAQSVHRELLLNRSDLATIDLTSASDTLAYELVKAVVPPDWFDLLDSCRSPRTFIDGKPRILEKFSSMGNGFTFELESMIFTALLSVGLGLTPGVDLWVFGDDIILPNELYDKAITILEVSGFTPNRRKSYGSGLFRESCGANVFNGTSVTPIRVKEPLEDPEALIAYHNALYHQGYASRRTLAKVRGMMPAWVRKLTGPEQLGDRVIHGMPYTEFYDSAYQGNVVWGLYASQRGIPLERWSPELALAALLLGSSTQVVRRNGDLRRQRRQYSVS